MAANSIFIIVLPMSSASAINFQLGVGSRSMRRLPAWIIYLYRNESQCKMLFYADLVRRVELHLARAQLRILSTSSWTCSSTSIARVRLLASNSRAYCTCHMCSHTCLSMRSHAPSCSWPLSTCLLADTACFLTRWTGPIRCKPQLGGRPAATASRAA